MGCGSGRCSSNSYDNTTPLLTAEDDKEKSFWDEVHGLAEEEIKANAMAGIMQPYIPSVRLRELYNNARVIYGADHHNIQILSGIFNFTA